MEYSREENVWDNNFVQNISQAKSDIFLMCSKIKYDSNLQVQIDGVDELNKYLIEKEKNTNVHIYSSKIFQILETGVTPFLLRLLQNISDI